MSQLRLLYIFIIIFLLSLLTTGFFGMQLRRNMPPAFANYLAADKGYGVTIDLTTYGDAALDDTLRDMHQSGLTWLRQPVLWADIEPVAGQFNWQPLDRVFAAVAKQNTRADGSPLQLIAVLHTSPEWATLDGSKPASPPMDLGDFGNFARAFAERYGHQLDYYQIWHEPNLSVSWGDTFVNPAAYADMLREAALNIRSVDSTSVILTAALATTLEDGPLNLNEISFLDQLYRVGAGDWFDVVAIQPYGLWTKPLDPAAFDQPNFRRAELVRQVMLDHDDAATPLWATAFGWVVLPADWAGESSPWSFDQVEVQAPRTAAAIAYARANWPWLGPMLAARWDTTGLAGDDPAQGFALTENRAILEIIQTAAQGSVATVGTYPANHHSGDYSPGWRFALDRADIPSQPPQTLTIPFEGTRLDLTVHRGRFRGYLWVTVDGQPANALPQDGRGQSYLVLYDPLLETETVTLARYLSPEPHEAVIRADGGWGQWAIGGWSVFSEADMRFARWGLGLAGLVALASGIGIIWLVVSLPVAVARLAWGWSDRAITLLSILGEPGQIIIILVLATGLYALSGWPLLILLLGLAGILLTRPDLGLVCVTFSLFFVRLPIRLPVGAVSPVELTLALTVTGYLFRSLVALGRARFVAVNSATQPQLQTGNAPKEIQPLSPKFQSPKRSTDLPALAFVLLGFLATLVAENFALSFREWRVIVVESVIFYFLVRLGLDYQSPPPSKPGSPHWVQRLIGAFAAGAVLQACLALYLYFFTEHAIDVEGVYRALGLGYGSPNNLALMLDRAWPILLALNLLPGYSRWIRGLAAAGLLLVSLALYLTFSKGALLLGLPAGLVVMTLLYGLQRWPHYRGRVLGAVVGVLALFGLVLIPFSQTVRFRATFSFDEGSTAFFRLKLWQAAWTMLLDNWPLGVGLDNFLHYYRTRYILPEAWQEPDLNHPHNLLLDFGTRLGIAGIGLLFWLQIAFWRNGWRLYRAQASPIVLGLLGSMAVMIGHGLVDNSVFLIDLAFSFFLVVGLVQRLAELSEDG